MKRKEIIAQIGHLINDTDGEQKSSNRAEAIRKLLAKLREKETGVMKKLQKATSEKKREKLERKLKACVAQREKGEAALADM